MAMTQTRYLGYESGECTGTAPFSQNICIQNQQHSLGPGSQLVQERQNCRLGSTRTLPQAWKRQPKKLVLMPWCRACGDPHLVTMRALNENPSIIPANSGQRILVQPKLSGIYGKHPKDRHVCQRKSSIGSTETKLSETTLLQAKWKRYVIYVKTSNGAGETLSS